MDRPHANNLRIGRVDEPGRIYLLTAVTAERQPFFLDLTQARNCIRALHFQDEADRTSTLAYVLMPDHLHWLITLNMGTLGDVMRSVKSYSARMINQQLGNSGKVWQHGYHDHALRRDEDVREVARYVVANPVRAGMVKSVWDYSFWDAVWVE